MNRRSGFSLIEVLVVITIIALLISGLWIAIGPGMARARESNTRTLLVKLGSMIQERMQSIEAMPIANESQLKLKSRFDHPTAANVTTMSQALADQVARRHRLRMAFPQRLEDLFGYDGAPDPYPPPAGMPIDDGAILRIWLQKTGGVLLPAGHRRENESAKLLYIALTQGGFGSTIDNIDPKHVAFLDPNDKAMDLPAFVDNWGNPIRFYLWPTRLVRPGGPGTAISQAVFQATAKVLVPSLSVPNTPSPFPATVLTNMLNQDPLDANGRFFQTLLSSTIETNPFRLTILDSNGSAVHPTTFIPYGVKTCPALDVNQFYELSTWHAPLVMSAGEDGVFGIEPTTAAGAARLCMPIAGQEDAISDNLTNLQAGR